jgi:hypothetical protein
MQSGAGQGLDHKPVSQTVGVGRRDRTERAQMLLVAPAVPITVIPRSRALCITAEPTPSAAPLTNSVWPDIAPT